MPLRKLEISQELGCTTYILHLLLVQLYENTQNNVPTLTSALRREVWYSKGTNPRIPNVYGGE